MKGKYFISMLYVVRTFHLLSYIKHCFSVS